MRRAGFTLLELIMALAASAVILAAIYGVFSRAIHLRDRATARTREASVRARASALIRDDLRHAYISGSTTANSLALSLTGSTEGPQSRFPGYVRLTTTTGRDDADTPGTDVQEVEYYIIDDPAAADRNAGLLVRTVNRTLLAQTREEPAEVPLLPGVERMDVEFYRDAAWTDGWQLSSSDLTLPEAIRVRLQLAASKTEEAATALEVVMPWTTQTFGSR